MGRHVRRRAAAIAFAAAAVGAGLVGVTPAEAAQTAAKPYDFNGDGYQDLALGSPYGDVGSTVNAGFIAVVYGSATGVTTRRTVINQNSAGIPGSAEAEDLFGSALTSADFDRDGYADLAVGVPGEDTNEGANAGYDTIIWGTPSGLADLASDGIEPVGAAAGNNYGSSLTTADLDGDGAPNLVVAATGTPSFYWYTFDAAAAVRTARTHGKVNRPPRALRAATPGVNAFYLSAGDVTGDGIDDLAVGWRDNDAPEPVDRAGFVVFSGSSDGTLTAGTPVAVAGIGAIAVGDFITGDGNADVAAGVSGDSPRLGGSVTLFAGSDTGVSGTPAQVVHQAGGVPSTAKAGDGLGWSLAAGDVNGDGAADLAIGAPLKDVGTLTDAGQAAVLYGSPDGLARGHVFTQNTGATPGTTEAGDQAGYNVALIDHNANGFADLSIGVPHENGYEGYINVLYGTADRITPAGSIGFGTGVLGVPNTTAQVGLRIGRL